MLLHVDRFEARPALTRGVAIRAVHDNLTLRGFNTPRIEVGRVRKLEIGLLNEYRFAETASRHLPIRRRQQADLKVRVLRSEISDRHRFWTGAMVLRLSMTIGTDSRVELNEIGWLVMLDVTRRAAICRHVRGSRMVSGHMLMQRARVAIETLLIAYPTEWLRVTRFALNLEITVR